MPGVRVPFARRGSNNATGQVLNPAPRLILMFVSTTAASQRARLGFRSQVNLAEGMVRASPENSNDNPNATSPERRAKIAARRRRFVCVRPSELVAQLLTQQGCSEGSRPEGSPPPEQVGRRRLRPP